MVRPNLLSRGATCGAIGNARSISGTRRTGGECNDTLKEEFYGELKRLGHPGLDKSDPVFEKSLHSYQLLR